MSRSWVRGSNVSIRVFAVVLLVAGVGIGVATGVTRQGGSDTLKVNQEAAPQPSEVVDDTIPAADASRAQPLPAGAQLLDMKRQQAALAAAQQQAKAKAAAANRAAAAKAADAARAAEKRASRSESRPSSSPSSSPQPGEAPPPAPVDCQQYSGNKQTGCALLPWAGFDTGQMSCLEPMWDKESGWNERSENTSSGAYGIPQALPASKMAAYGDDYRTNPVPQIKWGLMYIKGRYSTPCGAWSFWQANGWY